MSTNFVCCSVSTHFFVCHPDLRAWELEDGTLCAPGGLRREKPMSKEEIEALVAEQGGLVRKLKDEGMGNKDPQVVEAVQELLRLKGLLEEKE